MRRFASSEIFSDLCWNIRELKRSPFEKSWLATSQDLVE